MDARIGVDIGGTFTDVVTVRDGTIRATKTASTPDAPEAGVVDGLDRAADRAALSLADVDFLGHGTTVATNAVLEREWAETALVTTEGFRDALEIGRQTRPDIYDFRADKPAPVVPRDRRFEVTERLDERGTVGTPLDEDEVREIAATLADAGVESVAVSLLFSFENDDHERRVRQICEDSGLDAAYSLSSEVLPEIREYERTLATALNAALKPVMQGYLDALEAETADLGIPAELKIMQSNGGIITADAAGERPVDTLLSGPAAGVQGAAHVAGLVGMEDVVTMDMGGTSCDVSLVQGGDPVTSTEVEVGDYPVGVPTIDVHTIGAGGGSVAWVDAGDALRVGPRSAGADPGPVCYGRGGTEPTVTDAHLLLGRLNPENFLSDELDVEVEAVREAVERSVADPLGTSVEEAAQGILDVANANMERALRVVSVERGHDPREFGLVAFGGAGPLHAPKLAAELDVPRVLIPRTAGVLSALGLLVSDVAYDYGTSRVRPWSAVSPGDLREAFAAFEERGRERLAAEGFEDAARFERAVDLRYRGQSFELTVPVGTDDFDPDGLDDVAARFHEAHERRYGHASPDEPLELVTIRLSARGPVEPPTLEPAARAGSAEDAVADERTVVYDGDPREARVYDRTLFPAGAEFDGPAIVAGEESTVVVHPGQRGRVDEYGNILVEI